MNQPHRILIPAILFVFLSICFQFASAQCTPPMAETCDEASVLCSLDQLNGYTCANTSSIPSPCSPICSQGGDAGQNTSWWAFVCNGGNVCITLNAGTCTGGQGLQYGIWGDCGCGDDIICRSQPCITPNSISTACGYLIACKTYYLWVDGCNGDVCNFTLNTTGGGLPTLTPLGFINNIPSKIIQPICAGACSVLFFVNPQSGGCQPYYRWTLDGSLIDGDSNEIHMDIPAMEGDFVICVTAYVGNPQNGSICSQEGPQCATIKSRKIAEKPGLQRVLCSEQTKKGGYKWHSQKIINSGTYHEQFSNANCCLFDSVVEFIVLDPPTPEPFIYLGCDNKPYIDILGNKHFPCLIQSKILLPKTTDYYKCDSSIILTAINVDFAPQWSTNCYSDTVELIPNISIVKPCGAGEIYQFEYNWFKKSDTTTILGTDERLIVKSVAENYCLKVIVTTKLENESLVCTKTFCESIDEGNVSPECLPLSGTKIFCFDNNADYKIDNIDPKKVNSYNWTIKGGQFISKTDSSAVKVKWSFTQNDSGKICVSYNVDCGTSCEKCMTVLYETNIAGPSFQKRGLDAYLSALPNPKGSWRLISNPFRVTIDDPTNPRTRISAYYYGYYCFEWTISDMNCTIKDTQCVDLHNYQLTNPEYPKNIFDFRNSKSKQNQEVSIDVFTPNLIAANGKSYLLINEEIKSPLNYSWYDIYGRMILNQQITCESGIQRVEINSPKQQGLYFILLEVDGVHLVQKISVME